MGKTTDLVSVIIPTYNRLGTLKEVLSSYIDQKFVKEVVIVDDCSLDKTGQYLKSLAKNEQKIKYFRNPVNKGAPYSRNKAISKTTGKYIFIGEDDLELTDNYFKTLLDHMRKEGADIIAGRRIWMQRGEAKKDSFQRANKVKELPVNKNLLTTNCEVRLIRDTQVSLVDASMLFKKEIIDRISYDEHYRKNSWREETDFQLSALENGYNIVYCPHVVSYHYYKNKNTGGNHSRSLLSYETEIFKNNLYMARKHWSFLQREFGINYDFYFRFFVYRAGKLLMTTLSELKAKIRHLGLSA